MPRDGSGNYTLPYPAVVDGTTIESAVHNGTMSDIALQLNGPVPVIAGGTGANNAAGARTALKAEVAQQVVTNYDSHVFEAGSFYSTPGATTEPVAGVYFSGICHKVSGSSYILDGYTNNGALERWTRRYFGAWEPWVKQTGTVADADARYVNLTGDTMTGTLNITSTGAASLYLNGASIAGGGTVTALQKAGTNNWLLGHHSAILGSSSDDFTVYGAVAGIALQIGYSTNEFKVAGTITAGFNVGTGTYYFGNSGTRYLSYDGANYALNGGNLNLTGSGAFRTTNWGNLFGSAGGNITSASATNVVLYDMGGGNWAGIGADGGGQMYFRTGLSGTGTTPALKLQTDGVAVFGTAVFATNFNVSTQTGFGLFADATNNYCALSPYFNMSYNRVDGHTYFTPSSVNSMRLQSDGNLLMTSGKLPYRPGGGPWLDNSDERIKNVLGNYEHGLAEIVALQPVRYTFKGNNTGPDEAPSSLPMGTSPKEGETPPPAVVPYANSPHYTQAKDSVEMIGLIAQAVEGVLPEMVSKHAATIDGQSVTDLRTLDTGPLIFALINAVKELAAKVEALEAA